MAQLVGATTKDLQALCEKLGLSVDEMLAEMVVAGAQVVHDNMVVKMPSNFKQALTASNIELTKVYKTPSDGGINCQAKIVGYFNNRYGKKTPAPLVANMLEYGSTSRKYPKQAFLRSSFNAKQIEAKMLEIQEKYLQGVYDK